MNRLTTCLVLVFCWLGANAQPTDSVRPKAKEPFVFHHFSGFNITYANNQYLYDKGARGFGFGYFKDRKIGDRTFVMVQFNMVINKAVYYGQYYQWNGVYATYKDVDMGFDLDIPVRFGIRVGKEDGLFTLYPTMGFGFYLPLYYTSKRYVNGTLTSTDNGQALEDFPFVLSGNAGLEVKIKTATRQYMAIGYTYSLQGLLFDDFGDRPDYHSIYLKYGINRAKHVAKRKTERP